MGIKFFASIPPAIAAAMILAAPAMAQGNVKKGETVYEEYSAACHFEFKANGNNVGPNLSSVIGRKAGTFKGYSYSSSMEEAAHIWTEAALNRFLSGPQKMVRGNIMGFDGFDDANMRADVIAYLKQQQGK